MMSVRAESGETFGKQSNKYYAYKRDGETLSSAHVGYRYPITNFRYDKIKISPVLYATGDDPSQGEAFSATQNNLNTTGYPQYRTTRPYIVNVGFRIFVDLNGTWTQISATLDLNTILYGDNAQNWYSGQSNCYVLLNPYMNDYATGTNYNNWFFEWQSNNDMIASGFCNGSSVAKYSYYSFTSDTRDGVQCGLMPGFRFSERTEKNTGVAAIMRGLPWRNVSTLADYNDFIEDLKRELAYIGLPFVLEQQYISDSFGSDNVYLPIFDEHRQTTGDYSNGQASLALPNAQWQWIYDLDTLPDPPPDEDTPEGNTDIGDLTNTVPNRYSNAGGLQQWVVSQQTLIQLGAYLNGTYLPTSADLDADFKGTDPTQYIVSVQKYPFDIPYQGTSGTIHIGKNSSGLSGYQLFATWGGIGVLPINSYVTEDFGYIEIPYFFEDFRDYQSKILLFMPFIGTVELDPRLYIGTAVKLVYNIDYNTGAVCAEIKRRAVSDDQIERWLTMETKTSTISITVPFMAANMGQYQNQLAALDYSKEMTKIKGVQTSLSTGFQIGSAAMGSYSTGSVPGMGQLSAIASGTMQLAANATQLDYIDYQIEHTAPSVGTLSTASAANSFFMDDRARILIIRPQMIAGYSASEYSHTIGNACCKNGKISDFSGLLVCATAILSDIHTKELAPLQATEQEKKLLKAALQNGIYL